MKVRYKYTSIYNMRPEELYGMGKESLTVTSPPEGIEFEEFCRMMKHNSSLVFEDAYMMILGTEEMVEIDEWKPYIGQPMFFIVDLEIEKVK